jgi:hypothetical protein
MPASHSSIVRMSRWCAAQYSTASAAAGAQQPCAVHRFTA